jgi:hypothetical protein
MTYKINKTDGTVLAEVIDGGIDKTSSDITLIGKNVITYGEHINENFVKLLENFASRNAPKIPTTGQLWFDTNNGRLKVFDGNQFKITNGPIVSPTVPTSLSKGDLWFDSAANQMYFYDGGELTLAGPIYSTTQGVSGFSVDTVVDTNKKLRVIMRLSAGNSLLGIFSKDPDTFSLRDPIPGFSGPISTGFNPSTLVGQKFRATISETDGLLAADGSIKTPKSFMSAVSNTGTTGTVTLSNEMPLVLGNNREVIINSTSEVFNIVNTQLGKSIRVVAKTVTGLRDAIILDPQNISIGIFKEDPTSDVHVGGSAKISGDISIFDSFIVPETFTVSGKNLKLHAPLSQGIAYESANPDKIGISVRRGSNMVEPTLQWNVNSNKIPVFPTPHRGTAPISTQWEYANLDAEFTKILTDKDFPRFAFTGNFYDLYDLPEGGLWKTFGTSSNIYYDSGNVGVRVTSPQYQLDVNDRLFATSVFEGVAELDYDPGTNSIGTNSTTNNVTLNLSSAKTFIKSITRDTKFILSDIPSTCSVFTLKVVNGGNFNITWWDNISWGVGLSAPVLTTLGTDILTFFTVDNGLTWTGLVVGLEYQESDFIHWIHLIQDSGIITSESIAYDQNFESVYWAGKQVTANGTEIILRKYLENGKLVWKSSFAIGVPCDTIHDLALSHDGTWLSILASSDDDLVSIQVINLSSDTPSLLNVHRFKTSKPSLSHTVAARNVGSANGIAVIRSDEYEDGTNGLTLLFIDNFGRIIHQAALDSNLLSNSFTVGGIDTFNSELYIVGSSTDINGKVNLVLLNYNINFVGSAGNYSTDNVISTRFQYKFDDLNSRVATGIRVNEYGIYVANRLTDLTGDKASLVKFSFLGSPVWEKSFGYINDESNISLSIDTNGNFLVSWTDLSNIIVIEKVNVTGLSLFRRSFPLVNDSKIGNYIDFSQRGDMFVAGSKSISVSESVGVFFKLPGAGNKTGEYSVEGTTIDYDEVSFNSPLTSYTLSTNVIGKHIDLNFSTGNAVVMDVDSQGAKYFVFKPLSTISAIVFKLSNTGILEWAVSTGLNDDYGYKIVVDNNNNAYVSFVDYINASVSVFKVTSSGVEWKKTFTNISVFGGAYSLDYKNNFAIISFDFSGLFFFISSTGDVIKSGKLEITTTSSYTGIVYRFGVLENNNVVILQRVDFISGQKYYISMITETGILTKNIVLFNDMSLLVCEKLLVTDDTIFVFARNLNLGFSNTTVIKVNALTLEPEDTIELNNIWSYNLYLETDKITNNFYILSSPNFNSLKIAAISSDFTVLFEKEFVIKPLDDSLYIDHFKVSNNKISFVTGISYSTASLTYDVDAVVFDFNLNDLIDDSIIELVDVNFSDVNRKSIYFNVVNSEIVKKKSRHKVSANTVSLWQAATPVISVDDVTSPTSNISSLPWLSTRDIVKTGFQNQVFTIASAQNSWAWAIFASNLGNPGVVGSKNGLIYGLVTVNSTYTLLYCIDPNSIVIWCKRIRTTNRSSIFNRGYNLVSSSNTNNIAVALGAGFIKLSQTGNILGQFVLPTSADIVSLTFDNADNLYLLFVDVQTYVYTIVKLNSNFEEEWAVTEQETSDAVFRSIAVSDSVLILGGTRTTAVILKKDPNTGIQTGILNFNSAQDFEIFDTVIDSEGNFVAAGYVSTDTGIKVGVIKTSPNGNIFWSKILSDTQSSNIHLDNICLDDEDNIYGTWVSVPYSRYFVYFKLDSSTGNIRFANISHLTDSTIRTPSRIGYQDNELLINFSVIPGWHTINRLDKDGKNIGFILYRTDYIIDDYSSKVASLSFSSLGIINQQTSNISQFHAIETSSSGLIGLPPDNEFAVLVSTNSSLLTARVEVDITNDGTIYIQPSNRTFKISTTGNVGWGIEWPGSIWPTGISSIDSDILVTGWVSLSSPNYYFLMKFSNAGTMLFTRFITSPLSLTNPVTVRNDAGLVMFNTISNTRPTFSYLSADSLEFRWGRSVALTSGSTLYSVGVDINMSGEVVASVIWPTGTNIIVFYSATGQLLWQKFINSGTQLRIYIDSSPEKNILFDKEGNILVCYNSFVGSSTIPVLLKLDAFGNVLWAIRATISPNNVNHYPSGIAVDDDNNIFLIGFNQANPWSSWMLQFSPSSTLIRSYSFSIGGSWPQSVSFRSIKIDPTTGYPIIVAAISNYTSGIIVFKFNLETLVPPKTYVFEGFTYPYQLSITNASVLSLENVSGSTSTSTSSSLFFWATDESAWWQIFTRSTNSEHAYRLAIDSFNNIYAVGNIYTSSNPGSYVVKFNSSGGIIWQNFTRGQTPFPANSTLDASRSSSFACDVYFENGFVYVLSIEYFSMINYDAGWCVTKYTEAGTLIYSKIVYRSDRSQLTTPSPESYTPKLTVSNGIVFVAFRSRTSALGIFSLDVNGDLNWSNTFWAPTVQYNDFVAGIHTDSLQNVYTVVGWTGGPQVFGIIKFSLNGTLIWSKSFGASGLGHLPDVSAMIDNEIYVAGRRNSNHFVSKINLDGVVQWSTQSSNSSGQVAAIVKSSDNALFLISHNSNIIKFNPDTRSIFWQKNITGPTVRMYHAVASSGEFITLANYFNKVNSPLYYRTFGVLNLPIDGSNPFISSVAGYTISYTNSSFSLSAITISEIVFNVVFGPTFTPATQVPTGSISVFSNAIVNFEWNIQRFSQFADSDDFGIYVAGYGAMPGISNSAVEDYCQVIFKFSTTTDTVVWTSVIRQEVTPLSGIGPTPTSIHAKTNKLYVSGRIRQTISSNYDNPNATASNISFNIGSIAILNKETGVLENVIKVTSFKNIVSSAVSADSNNIYFLIQVAHMPILMKFDLLGNLIWSAPLEINQPVNISKIEVLPSGEVAVLFDKMQNNSSASTNSSSTKIAGYICLVSQDGTSIVWSKQFFVISDDTLMVDITSDIDGNIYIVGSSQRTLNASAPRQWFVKLSSSGTALLNFRDSWNTSSGSQWSGFVKLVGTDIYTGTGLSNSPFGLMICKYNSAGVLQFARHFDTRSWDYYGFPMTLQISGGNMYIPSYFSGLGRHYTLKAPADGTGTGSTMRISEYSSAGFYSYSSITPSRSGSAVITDFPLTIKTTNSPIGNFFTTRLSSSAYWLRDIISLGNSEYIAFGGHQNSALAVKFTISDGTNITRILAFAAYSIAWRTYSAIKTLDNRIFVASSSSSGAGLLFEIDTSLNLIQQVSIPATNIELYSITTDTDNNLYVAGRTGDLGVLFKLTSTFNLLLTKLVAASNPVVFYSVAVGTSGIYVSGGITGLPNGIVVIKYDHSGNSLWKKHLRYTSSGNYDTKGFSILLDNDENVFVAGNEYTEAVLVKFDSSGTLLWKKILNLSSGNGKALSTFFDPSGNVAVCGPFGSSGSWSIHTNYNLQGSFIVTLNPVTGATVSSYIFRYSNVRTTMYPFTIWNAIVTNNEIVFVGHDNVGGIFGSYPISTTSRSLFYGNESTPLTLAISPASFTSSDWNNGVLDTNPAFVLTEFITNSAVSVTRFVPSSIFSSAELHDIISDQNFMYVCGACTNNYDWYIAKLNFDDTIVWQKRIAGNSSDYAYRIKIDSSGNLYVIGQLYANSGTSYMDPLIMKFDPNGNILDSRKFVIPGASTADGQAYDMSIDSLGNIYIAAQQYMNYSNSAYYVANLVKLDSSLNLVWEKMLYRPGYWMQSNTSVGVDTDNNVYFCFTDGTYLFIQKYDSAGTKLWGRSYFDSYSVLYPRRIEIAPNGSVYICFHGGIQTEATFAAIVMKIDPASGSILWQRNIYSGSFITDYLRGSIVDSDSNVYITGYFGLSNELMIAKILADGTVDFIRAIDAANAVIGYGLTILPNNVLKCAGSIQNSSGYPNIFIVSIDLNTDINTVPSGLFIIPNSTAVWTFGTNYKSNTRVMSVVGNDSVMLSYNFANFNTTLSTGNFGTTSNPDAVTLNSVVLNGGIGSGTFTTSTITMSVTFGINQSEVVSYREEIPPLAITVGSAAQIISTQISTPPMTVYNSSSQSLISSSTNFSRRDIPGANISLGVSWGDPGRALSFVSGSLSGIVVVAPAAFYKVLLGYGAQYIIDAFSFPSYYGNLIPTGESVLINNVTAPITPTVTLVAVDATERIIGI